MKRIELQTTSWVSLYIDEETVIKHNKENGITDPELLESVELAMQSGYCPLTQGGAEELELSEGSAVELLSKGVGSSLFTGELYEE
jgi:hypothetical protein